MPRRRMTGEPYINYVAACPPLAPAPPSSRERARTAVVGGQQQRQLLSEQRTTNVIHDRFASRVASVRTATGDSF